MGCHGLDWADKDWVAAWGCPRSKTSAERKAFIPTQWVSHVYPTPAHSSRSCMVSSLGVLVGYKAELELQKEAAAVAHRIQWRP